MSQLFKTPILSDVPNGTAPFVIASFTEVANLNAQYVGGYSAVELIDRAEHTGTQAASTVTVTPSGNLASSTADLAFAEHQLDIDTLWLNSIFQGRLSLAAGLDYPSSDTTSANLYITQARGDKAVIYDGSKWVPRTFKEFGYQLSGLTSGKPYDLFLFYSTATPSSTNTTTEILTFGSATGWATGSYVSVATTGGGLTAGNDYWYNAASSTTGSLHTTLADALAGTNKVNLSASITSALSAISGEAVAWTNDSTRATAIVRQNGIKVKSGAATRLLVGGFYTSSTSTTDFNRKLFVYNEYNQVEVLGGILDGTGHTQSTTGTTRQFNGSTTDQVEIFLGNQAIAEVRVWASLTQAAGNLGVVSYGYNSTSTETSRPCYKMFNGILTLEFSEKILLPAGRSFLSANTRAEVSGVSWGAISLQASLLM